MNNHHGGPDLSPSQSQANDDSDIFTSLTPSTTSFPRSHTASPSELTQLSSTPPLPCLINGSPTSMPRPASPPVPTSVTTPSPRMHPDLQSLHASSSLLPIPDPGITFAPRQPRPLIPPLSFAMVAAGIYRSGYPLEINFEMLEKLKLKSIIYLSDTDYLPPNTQWIQRHHIILFHFRIPPVKEPFIENDAYSMKKALEVLLDARNHPVLIHSNKGKHRAGVLVGCMRKLLMGWSLAATHAEYGRYAGGKGEADLEFIELFEPELEFDKRWMPGWVRI